MTSMLRFTDLALGELERDVLDALWTEPALTPGEVHVRVGQARGISVNTVQSALKRLFEKGLLGREKVSHAYVYHALVSRAELQRQLLGEIDAQFSDQSSSTFLAAFLDLAEEQGEETMRRLEQMIAARLRGDAS